MATPLKSIGAGPFEFPISGEFNIEREGGATVFTTSDETRRYLVAFFRNNSSGGLSSTADQIAKLEEITKRSWERFANQEKGEIVQAFRRIEAPSGITVFSMATEFVVDGRRQYYVQFGATDGPRFATVFAEGFGRALQPLGELEPLVLQVRIANDIVK